MLSVQISLLCLNKFNMIQDGRYNLEKYVYAETVIICK